MCFLKKLGREKGNLLAVTDEVQVHGSENGLARGLGAHGCKKRGVGWGDHEVDRFVFCFL